MGVFLIRIPNACTSRCGSVPHLETVIQAPAHGLLLDLAHRQPKLSAVGVSPTLSPYYAAGIPFSEPSKVYRYRVGITWKTTQTYRHSDANNHTRGRDQHLEEAWSYQFKKPMVKISQARSKHNHFYSKKYFHSEDIFILNTILLNLFDYI